jgi:HEPN domain-containing protein
VSEAERAYKQEEWRLCVRSSRDGVESGAKSVIACFGPVEKTHNVERQLNYLIEKGLIAKSVEKEVKELIEISSKMGFKKHILLQYGDEDIFRDPWQLFDETAAEEALEIAHISLEIARKVYNHLCIKPKE